MKKGLTKIIFVVDRSGSMESVASDMIGGFNRYIKKQKENKVGECTVTFNQFDDIFENVYKNVLVENVEELTDKTYQPRNMTALYDAVCRTIDEVGSELAALPEEERPEKVLVVILTDGLENASTTFNRKDVQEKIKHQTETYKWEFVYIGANQDSWAVGESIGIDGSNTISYVSTGKNTKLSNESLWDTLGAKTISYRSCVSAKMSFTPEEQEEQERFVKNNTP
jgi:nitrate/nitrite-specific signal transduction histidine kinase